MAIQGSTPREYTLVAKIIGQAAVSTRDFAEISSHSSGGTSHEHADNEKNTDPRQQALAFAIAWLRRALRFAICAVAKMVAAVSTENFMPSVAIEP